MPHPYTRSNINQVEINAIPVFDGNTVTLPLFIDACEDLLTTYADKIDRNNPINPFLLKVIKSRFAGEAQFLIASRELQSWKDIKTCLELNYSDQRTEDCLLTDLMQVNS